MDVTGRPVELGVASLESHAAYLAALPDHPAPADFIPKILAANGKLLGVKHAVLFRAVDRHAPPPFLDELT